MSRFRCSNSIPKSNPNLALTVMVAGRKTSRGQALLPLLAGSVDPWSLVGRHSSADGPRATLRSRSFFPRDGSEIPTSKGGEGGSLKNGTRGQWTFEGTTDRPPGYGLRFHKFFFFFFLGTSRRPRDGERRQVVLSYSGAPEEPVASWGGGITPSHSLPKSFLLYLRKSFFRSPNFKWIFFFFFKCFVFQ